MYVSLKQNKITNVSNRSIEMSVSSDQIDLSSRICEMDKIREHCFRLRVKVDADSETEIEQIQLWANQIRDEIIAQEESALSKFDETAFTSMAKKLEPIVQETESFRDRIDQQMKQGDLDPETEAAIIKEATIKLEELKRHKQDLKRVQFSGHLVEYTSKSTKTYSSCIGRLDNFDIGLNKLQHMTAFRRMNDFVEMSYCFINPFATQHELIAIVINRSKQLVFIKTDLEGNVTLSKVVDQKPRTHVIYKVETLPESFIVLTGEMLFNKFDYDFNQLEVQNLNDNQSHTEAEFAANADLLFQQTRNTERVKSRGPAHIYYRDNDDYHEDVQRLSEDCWVDCIYDLVANDDYLFIFTYDKIRVVELESDNVVKDRYIHYGHKFGKLIGDKYIASFDGERRVILFSQDDKADKLKELEVNVPCGEKLRMAANNSEGVCFFTRTGDVYHNLC